MGKALGAMAFIVAAGVGVSSLLSGVLGVYAEAASVSFMGLGLLASGQILGARWTQAGTTAQPINQN
jgi:hypothetical protein